MQDQNLKKPIEAVEAQLDEEQLQQVSGGNMLTVGDYPFKLPEDLSGDDTGIKHPGGGPFRDDAKIF